MPSFTYLHTLYNNKNTNKRFVAKIISLTCLHTLCICVHNLYYNKNINKKSLFQYSQSYMCSYPLQKQKHKQKGSLPISPVLHVYIPSTTTQSLTERLFDKMTSLTCVHTIYNYQNINTKARFQNSQSYMCTHPIQ